MVSLSLNKLRLIVNSGIKDYKNKSGDDLIKYLVNQNQK